MRCPIRKIIIGEEATDGAGVRLTRVFGHHETGDFDPFLMLDAFDSDNPDEYVRGFPWHPHRGIETITYLIEGDIEHKDSLGNHGSIRDGDCQWMTAGSGIIHQEMPQPTKRLRGTQLWLNLPARNKMTRPKYHGIQQEDIPVVETEGSRVRIIAGKYGEVDGRFAGDFVRTTYLDVEVFAGCEWSFPVGPGATVFAYMLDGSGRFGDDERLMVPRQAVLFDTGDSIVGRASDQGVRFLLLAANPLGEPIAWGGPIVMNTRSELDQAFLEIGNGTFIRI
jgi:redox-sensitive bicupin YhaK (pirin superfamily)